MFSKYLCFNTLFVYCNLFVFKILGLLPWKINFSSWAIHPHSNSDGRMSNDTKEVMSVSIWGITYSIIILVFNYLSNIYAFQYILELNKSSKMPIVIRAAHIAISKYQFYSINCVWILYILHKNTVFYISEELIKVGKMLNNSIKYNWQVTPRIGFIFVINIGVSTVLIALQLPYENIVCTFTWCISVVASTWVLIQYALIFEVIDHQLKLINREILNFGNISDNIKIRNIFISKLPMRDNSECHIVNFKYVYNHLCDIFDKLSYFYAIPVILCVISFGLSMTFTAYYELHKFFFVQDSSLQDVIIETMWFITIASAFITLITAVNNIKREISIIPDNLHWLLNLCSMSEDMENALMDFSYDLLRRKINFTAYGIIPLDGSLLFSMVGSTITYLVIFLQFQSK